jgi:Doubled CXXCH motif (Paired_CXXCH_1)
MDHLSSRTRLLLFVAAVMLVTLVVTGVSIAGQQPTKAAPAATSGDYVGSDTCVTCHEDQNKRFSKTVMGKAFANPHTPEEKLGCESCHGPGKAHVDAGGGKDTIPIRYGKDSHTSVAEQNQSCIQCHSKGNRMFWSASPHASRGMLCVDCHNVKQEVKRSVGRETFLPDRVSDIGGLKKRQTELCLECHEMRKAQLQRSSHMPFREA